MSHSRHDTAAKLIYAARSISTELNRPISLLLDTQGPAIRTGDLATKLDLKAGDTLTLAVRGHKPEEIFSVDTNYDDLVKDIKVGDVVLVDNGVIQMAVKEKSEFLLRCEVLTPGSLGSRRHINLPGVKVNLPAITEKDWADILFGLESGVDWIALSFVREAADVRQCVSFWPCKRKTTSTSSPRLKTNPRWSPVFAFTPDTRLGRRLRLRFALEPIGLPFSEQPKETIHAAEKIC